MKAKKLALLIFVFLGVYKITAGQGYSFKVLVNKGKNEIKSGASWHPMKVGASLKADDEVKVSENAYLGLVHVSGKPLELKQSGKYKVADLAAKVSGGSSVLNKYTDFILSVNENKSGMAATGAVRRGEEITLDLPQAEDALIYNDEIIITWNKEKFPGPYVVKFSSMFEDELKQQQTSTNSLRVDLRDKSFENEDNILVEVISMPGGGDKAEPQKVSGKYTLRRLSKADRERIKSSLGQIDGPLTEPTALNKLVLAGFYEQNNLLIDAITAYQEAIKLAPDVPYYTEEYHDFLIRHRIREVVDK